MWVHIPSYLSNHGHRLASGCGNAESAGYTAAYHGQLEAVRVLLDLGASPAGYDVERPVYADYPATVLGAAREQGHGEVAALLEARQ